MDVAGSPGSWLGLGGAAQGARPKVSPFDSPRLRLIASEKPGISAPPKRRTAQERFFGGGKSPDQTAEQASLELRERCLFG